MSKKVIIIEDDQGIADLLSIHLMDLDFEPTVYRDGREGLDAAMTGEFDLAILDLMLPSMDGLEICRKIRGGGMSLPIMMLTSKSEELDKVLGLEMGADDYLTKPFSIREFIARVKALFRRIEAMSEAPATQPVEIIELGALVIDAQKRKVLLNGLTIDLTAKEFELLALFAAEPGRCWSRQDLLDKVWGYQFNGYEHTVNSHINRLRAKIEKDPSRPDYIQTVWGVGYKIAEAN